MELTPDMQTDMDIVQQRNVTNPVVKTDGAPLTAAEYNAVNNMFVAFCNLNNDNTMALKDYILKYLPNFMKLVVDGKGNVETLTANNGVLTIDLYNHFKNMSIELRDTTNLLLEDLTVLQTAINAEIAAREADIADCVDVNAYALDQLTKADVINPVLTGTLSQNRKTGSTVGAYSTALNENNSATAEASLAQGVGTVAGSYAQNVRGKYNVPDTAGKYAEIVGNGSSDVDRHNMYELDWSGNLKLTGEVFSKNLITNMLKPDLQTTTLNGLTCTNNGDGTYTISPGTASGNTFFPLMHNPVFTGMIKMCGCPAGGSDMTYLLAYSNNVDGAKVDLGNGVTTAQYNASTYNTCDIGVLIKSGTVITTPLVFKPMLTTNLSATYSDYVPFTGASGALNKDVADMQKTVAIKGDRKLLWANDSGIGAGNAINFDTTKYAVYEILLNTGAVVNGVIFRSATPNKMQASGGAILYDGSKYIPGVAILAADAYDDHLWIFECSEYCFNGPPYPRVITRIWGVSTL